MWNAWPDLYFSELLTAGILTHAGQARSSLVFPLRSSRANDAAKLARPRGSDLARLVKSSLAKYASQSIVISGMQLAHPFAEASRSLAL
jgi:hypothetical protein